MSSARALEAPRPLKSTIKQQSLPLFQQQQSFEVQSVEDLISLTETVAQSLNQGDVSFDLFNKMFVTLQIHGAQLETYFKEVLDRCFNVFRNASQDDRLKIAIRLNLLNLIELRANSWVNKCADYYKSKANEPENELLVLGTSPSLSGMAGAANMVSTTLAPGEVVKNSGKFAKPTKIPGKNYSKDEIIIRNSDSGKVNPGAKERLVQITGPNEESINYAKMLIEDTIKRNASPIRETSQEGSISSLTSSADDQQIAAMRSRPILTSVGSAIQMQSVPNVVQQLPMGNKLTRSNSHHYFAHNQQNDASVGEFKYTVQVGDHVLKISGDSLKLVQAAKLILDDYFTNEEFLKPTDAMIHADSMIPHQIPQQSSDSGVHLDFLARCNSGMVLPNALETGNDDEVFVHDPSPPLTSGENNVLTSSSSIESSSSSNTVTEHQPLTPGLSRSKRSHFSRKDSTPDNKNKNDADQSKQQRICYSVSSLWWFCKNSPACKAPPKNIEKIRETCSFIVRDKQGDSPNLTRYCDVEKFMELRERMDKRNMDLKCDDVIEIDDED